MNDILIETHKKSNIELLKARDYFFEIARKQNRFVHIFSLVPIILLAISFLPSIKNIEFIDESRDIIIGLLSIIAFALNFYMSDKISKNKEISSTFREEYDNRVFNIPRNPFLHDFDHNIETYINKSKLVKNRDKYEIWYEEIFCGDRARNILCCQMDNTIYTLFIYRTMHKIYIAILVVFLAVTVSLCVFLKDALSSVLIIVALFDAFQVLVEDISGYAESISQCKKIVDKVYSLESDFDNAVTLRCIQDCICFNRINAQFVFKFVRNIYLREDSPFYKELNKFKAKFLIKETTQIPASATDLELVSINGSKTYSLQEVQNRLLYMLSKIKEVFDRESIHYTLDGGTLIGAIRENGKFLFWDDDIDIAIPYEELERAKNAVAKELGDIFDIQDYFNEKFYSPRLSNFRVREKNNKSITVEKDSDLCLKYERKGLFIDIYAYSPILLNKTVDKIFRVLLIHPINKRIKLIEDKCIYSKNPERNQQSFLKLKNKYQKRVLWYLKNAKNRKYYSYAPNYLNDIKKAGPYISVDYLYGDEKFVAFENSKYRVPTNPEKILAECYGKNWNESPYISMDSLIEKYGENWYSYNYFLVSSSKHIRYIDLY